MSGGALLQGDDEEYEDFQSRALAGPEESNLPGPFACPHITPGGNSSGFAAANLTYEEQAAVQKVYQKYWNIIQNQIRHGLDPQYRDFQNDFHDDMAAALGSKYDQEQTEVTDVMNVINPLYGRSPQ